ncbi:RNA polymerase sigma factor [Burkholderia cepacia]|uniref:RNA polymerase sigma factor n=1 Tax=Burkholderia cepacia TaxID=292 RepID=UPI002AB6B926|nr:sigma-70 family RNA polymerase sigma factor [Burkholderia cepacia]
MMDELEQTYRRLRRYLARELGPADGADVLHTAFDMALNYAQKQPVRSLGGLLGKITRQLLIDQGRRRRNTPVASGRFDEPVCELTPERQVAARQELANLCEAIDSLPPRCREAFILCKLHGMTYHQAAAEMAIQPEAVCQYLVQAMKACRRAVTP